MALFTRLREEAIEHAFLAGRGGRFGRKVALALVGVIYVSNHRSHKKVIGSNYQIEKVDH